MNATLGRAVVALVVFSALPAAARAAERRTLLHPEFADRLSKVKTLAVARPELELYQLTAGGGRVHKPDWSEQASDRMARLAASVFGARGFRVVPLETPPAAKEDLAQANLLYDRVLGAVVFAVYGHEFPAKVARFEYSVGDLSPALGPDGPDAVLFVRGQANISSGGRKTLQVLSGVIGGTYSVGVDTLAVALVARGGEVLWFDLHRSSSYDLRDDAGAEAFLTSLHDLPEARR